MNGNSAKSLPRHYHHQAHFGFARYRIQNAGITVILRYFLRNILLDSDFSQPKRIHSPVNRRQTQNPLSATATHCPVCYDHW